MTETNKLEDAILNIFAAEMEDIHTCLPGRVESYDYKTANASVLPLIKKSYIDGTELSLGILHEVPVIFPRTATSGLTFPIKKGDRVLILFSERSLDKWYTSGKEDIPGDNRKFDFSDAVCIPGLYSFNNRNLAKNNDDMTMQHEGQTVTIKKNGDIEVGGSALKKLVTESFKDLYNNHTHIIPTSLPTVPPATVPTAIPTIQVTDSILTSKVKAQ